MIVFSSVTKEFPDGTVALKDISFNIDEGELVLITGQSGSGKTTLMRLLIREYVPTEGNIEFLEENLSEIRSSQIPHHRRKIGVAFQDYKLLPDLNVWENIALPLYIAGTKEPEIEERVTDLLKLTSLTDKALMFPVQLSGGEAQRVSIARALATGPKIIFADEPTGNLDPQNSLSIIKLLQKINELGTTVLLATHDAIVLKSLEDIRKIILKEGELTEDTGADAKKTKTKSEKSAKNKKVSEEKEEEKKPETDEKESKEVKKEDKVNREEKEGALGHKSVKKKKTRVKIGLSGLKLPFGKKKAKPADSDKEDITEKTKDKD